jgi:Icc protein
MRSGIKASVRANSHSSLLRSYKHAIFFLYLIVFYHTLCGQNTTFRFVFMTDTHLTQDSTAIKGFTRAIDRINMLNPDFVIAGGDMIMNNPGTTYKEVMHQYQLYNKLAHQLEMPIYHTIGNHDVIGLYQPPDFNKKHPDYGKNIFLRLFKLHEPYYSFDHKGWHFIILDNIRISGNQHYQGLIDTTQLVWLKQDLSAIAAHTPLVVALHIPMASIHQQVTSSTTKPLSSTQILSNTPDVLALFEDKNLRLVLQGHLHIVEEMVYKNIRFITGGAISGAWWRGAKDGFQPGFVLVDIDNDDVTWEYVNYLSKPRQ